MRRRAALLLFLALPGAVGAASVELPEWEQETGANGYYLGGGLWPKTLIPDAVTAARQPGEAGATGETPAPEGAVAQAPGATQFYGPQGPVDGEVTEGAQGSLNRVTENADGTFVVPVEIVEEEAYEPLPPIEGELRDLYFAHAPVDFLIDPQRLLTEQKSNDIKRFLEFHSDESDFRIYVMAIGESQKIPEDINLQELHHKWFSDSPSVIMLYYREQPQMTQLVFNETVKNSMPKSVFDRILQNCLREGGVTDLAPDQVEKMAIELSIQLYWLSRLMEHENKEDQERAASTTIHDMTASPDAPELLREYAPAIFVEDTGKVLSLLVTIVVVLVSLASLAFIGWVFLWWRSRETVSGQPIIFPEFRIGHRLGGEFSGGGFVGMSFDLGETTT